MTFHNIAVRRRATPLPATLAADERAHEGRRSGRARRDGCAPRAVVGVTLLQTRGEHTTAPGAVGAPRKGAPPLELDFGVRDDAEARALARAATPLQRRPPGRRPRPSSPATARSRRRSAPPSPRWPGHALDDLKRIVSVPSAERARGAAPRLGVPLVGTQRRRRRRLGARGQGAARLARRRRRRHGAPLSRDRSGPADRRSARCAPPPAIAKLPAAAGARRSGPRGGPPDANAKLLYGLALWHLERPVSAERQFRRAAALAPHDPLAQTLAAVGAFSKARPVTAFSRLGPLTGVFPKAAVVRFHLGILLIWTRQLEKGEQQLRLAIADNPKSIYANASEVTAGRDRQEWDQVVWR